MTHVQTELGPWCIRCGGPAILEGGSLDPAHPIGRCRPADPKRVGCGRQLLTVDLAASWAARDAYLARIALSRHAQHIDDRGRPHLNPRCSACMAAKAAHDAGR